MHAGKLVFAQLMEHLPLEEACSSPAPRNVGD